VTEQSDALDAAGVGEEPPEEVDLANIGKGDGA